jgi:hypothetical protein
MKLLAISCPKSNSSSSTPWKAVGCKRGTLSDEMQSVNLCPILYCEALANDERSADPVLFSLNPVWDSTARLPRRRRSNDIDNESASGDRRRSTNLGRFLHTLASQPVIPSLVLSSPPDSAYSALTTPLNYDQWLDKCLMEIVWEFLDQPEHLSALSLFDGQSETALPNFTTLLKCAILYEAQFEIVSDYPDGDLI